MRKYVFGVLVFILFCTSIHAQTFIFETIKYNITDTTNNYVEVGDNTSFRLTQNPVGGVNIPTSVNDYNDNNKSYTVTAISDGAFYGSALTSITIGNSVTSIGDNAFTHSGLGSITIGNSVTSIGRAAFNTTYLRSIIIPDSVTSIGMGVFGACMDLESVTLGNSLTSISEGAFVGCYDLRSITIPDSVTSIGDSAFVDNGLTSIIIPDSVTSIGAGVFSGCGSLESVTIPDSVTSISLALFYGCQALRSITIPDSVTSIGELAFYNTGLRSITIPDSVTSIGANAFSYCRYLEIVTIGSSVTFIDTPLFYASESIRRVTSFNPTPPTVKEGGGYWAFDSYSYTYGTLYVPAGSESAYGNAYDWERFDNIVLNIEQLNEVTVMVYPNPVVETLHIQLQPNDRLTSVTLHNIKGQKMLKSTTKIIDLSSLTSGVYFATIITNNGKATKKIIK